MPPDQLGHQGMALCVVKEGGQTEVAHMVGPSPLVQEEVPVVEGGHAVVQVPDDLMGQPQGALERVLAAELAELDAALGDDELLVREPPPGQVQGLEVVPAVPVEGRSGHQGVRLRVDDVPHPLIDPLLVVVPEEDLHVLQPVPPHGGGHEIPQEFLLPGGGEDAGVPGLDRLGLVLQGDPPH